MKTPIVLASFVVTALAAVTPLPPHQRMERAPIPTAKLDIGGPHGNYTVRSLDEKSLLRHVKRGEALPAKKHRRSKKGKRQSCSAGSEASVSPTAVAKIAVQPSSSSSSDAAASQSTSSSSSSTSDVSGSVSSLGISGFTGTNSGIGSWFRTDSSQDSTNGRSWCQTEYQDSWLGFAPDVSTMLNNFGGDYTKAGTAYCGLEAKATNPNNGKTALIYIVDGFDSKWVRTPGSIDLTLGAFNALYGSTTDDKDIVIQNLQWELTGNRNSAYGFKAGN